MRVFAAVAFSSAVLLAPVFAAAQETTASAAPTALATSDSSGVNLDEVLCKNSPPPLGSRLGGGRECHTQREWNQREKEAQDMTRQQQHEGYAIKGK